MLSHPALVVLALGFLVVLGFLAYVYIKYTPVVVRIVQETPVFQPLHIDPIPADEEVRFTTSDGLSLAGSFFRARGDRRNGLIVFCHEYLGSRWSVLPYADALRGLGFDLFSFDFRNHGDSDREERYEPLQWVSDREQTDLRAALDYLRSRPDHDPAGFGLYGISRGGGTAIAVGAESPDVWAVVTDGAFPIHGTMLKYILRWAEIYVGRWFPWKSMPVAFFAGLAIASRLRAERVLNRKFISVERAATLLAPRPLLMIHGERDNYIGPDIARGLFDAAREPRELWLVPGAKHNRCREQDPETYSRRLLQFFDRWAPRTLPAPRPSHTPPLFEPAVSGSTLPSLAMPTSSTS